MIEILTYCIFFSEVIFINYIDYRINKSIINPIACLSIPFVIILVLSLILNNHIHFIPFYYGGLWIWSIGLFFFWLPGLLIFNKRPFKVSKREIFDSTSYDNILVKAIILFSILYMLLMSRGISGGYELGSKELGQEISMGGIKGRVSNILLVACPFIACFPCRKIIRFILLCLMLYILMAFGSKTWLLYALLSCAFCIFFQKKVKLRLRNVNIVVIGAVCLFSLYYLLNTDIEEFGAFVKFISRHFYFYLTSGVLPLGEYVRFEEYKFRGEFLLPFINIFDVWAGNSGGAAHSSLWYITDEFLLTPSNVFTFFGTFFRGNVLLFLLYSMLFGLISYTIHLFALKDRNIFLSIMESYNLCVLFFGWYNCAYGLLRIWEIFLISIFLYIISMLKFKLHRGRPLVNVK